jgi:hypothetical protein
VKARAAIIAADQAIGSEVDRVEAARVGTQDLPRSRVSSGWVVSTTKVPPSADTVIAALPVRSGAGSSPAGLPAGTRSGCQFMPPLPDQASEVSGTTGLCVLPLRTITAGAAPA